MITGCRCAPVQLLLFSNLCSFHRCELVNLVVVFLFGYRVLSFIIFLNENLRDAFFAHSFCVFFFYNFPKNKISYSWCVCSSRINRIKIGYFSVEIDFASLQSVHFFRFLFFGVFFGNKRFEWCIISWNNGITKRKKNSNP